MMNKNGRWSIQRQYKRLVRKNSNHRDKDIAIFPTFSIPKLTNRSTTFQFSLLLTFQIFTHRKVI